MEDTLAFKFSHNHVYVCMPQGLLDADPNLSKVCIFFWTPSSVVWGVIVLVDTDTHNNGPIAQRPRQVSQCGVLGKCHSVGS